MKLSAFKRLGLVCTGLIISAFAQAGIITQEFEFSLVAADNSGFTTETKHFGNSANTAYYLNGFDSSLGTLESVKITFEATPFDFLYLQVEDPSIGWLNEAGVEGSVQYSTHSFMHLYSGSQIAQAVFLYTRTGASGCMDSGNIVFGTGDGFCESWRNLNWGTWNYHRTISDNAKLSLFNDASVRVDGFNSFSSHILCYDDEDICYAETSSRVSGTYKLEYHYQVPGVPVPAPPSGWLFLTLMILNTVKRCRPNRVLKTS